MLFSSLARAALIAVTSWWAYALALAICGFGLGPGLCPGLASSAGAYLSPAAATLPLETV
jgi:hypothetical protein